MNKKKIRILYITISPIIICIIVIYMLAQLKENISFFQTVTQIITEPKYKKNTRVGGIVIKGSVRKSENNISFTITDNINKLQVIYQGILPPLFAENTEVVVNGNLKEGVFYANQVLAKHDERYTAKYDK